MLGKLAEFGLMRLPAKEVGCVSGPVGSNPTLSAEGRSWVRQAVLKTVGCNSLEGSSPSPSSGGVR